MTLPHRSWYHPFVTNGCLLSFSIIFCVQKWIIAQIIALPGWLAAKIAEISLTVF